MSNASSVWNIYDVIFPRDTDFTTQLDVNSVLRDKVEFIDRFQVHGHNSSGYMDRNVSQELLCSALQRLQKAVTEKN